ncbi:hypothetical protein HDV57DRAFT_15127 [Trichoderma longibrachiatum]
MTCLACFSLSGAWWYAISHTRPYSLQVGATTATSGQRAARHGRRFVLIKASQLANCRQGYATTDKMNRATATDACLAARRASIDVFEEALARAVPEAFGLFVPGTEPLKRLCVKNFVHKNPSGRPERPTEDQRV